MADGGYRLDSCRVVGLGCFSFYGRLGCFCFRGGLAGAYLLGLLCSTLVSD